MIEPTPRPRAVTRQELEDIKAEARETRRIAQETHDMTQELHKALMQPFPGQKESLLDRMASVTINVESGGRVAAMAVKIAAALAALGALWAMITAIKP
jgi:dsDNA-specific endonuclease/ATPase MutS2